MLHSRLQRVSEQIKSELGEIIDQKLNNPRIPPFVTVHSVKVARDLRTAQVQVTFLQDDDAGTVETAIAELKKAAGFIRAELGRRITLRYIPQLHFHYNPSTRYATEIDQLLRENSPAPGNTTPDANLESPPD